MNPSPAGTTLTVTSLAEVWIEISFFQCKKGTGAVTSLAEVWIEICMDRHLFVQ